MKSVKFLDLKAQYPKIKEDILRKFDDIIDNTAFISGKYVQELEQSFAGYLGTKHCIAVDNGTNALLLCMLAHGIGAGDDVLVPTNTFIATAEAVSLAGAKPVFVDIREDTYLMDLKDAEKRITKKTKAIIPVHLFGQCMDMYSVNGFANRHKLIVVEDACQAHGAEFKGKKAGTFGRCAAFSAYPGKNLGTWGEGGMVVTDDDSIAEKIRLMRDHGSRKKYHHEIVGGNFRMSEFQAAVLSTKLKYLDEWNEGRRKNADIYAELLKGNPDIILPTVEENSRPIWHLFVVRIKGKGRDVMIEHLKKHGIQSGIHYPFPLHMTEAYGHLGYSRGDLPVAERVQDEIISLPMYAELEREDIDAVCEAIESFFV